MKCAGDQPVTISTSGGGKMLPAMVILKQPTCHCGLCVNRQLGTGAPVGPQIEELEHAPPSGRAIRLVPRLLTETDLPKQALAVPLNP